jgi:outer membrane protein TolC
MRLSVEEVFRSPVLPADEHFPADHPELTILKAAVASAHAAVESSKAQVMPDLSAAYTRSRQGDTFFPSEEAHWTASASVSWPIFAGGPTASFESIRASRLGESKALEELREGRRRLESAWVSARAVLEGKVDQVGVRRLYLEAARQRNEEALVRYSNGLMTFENWSQVVSELVSAERSALQSERQVLLAEASWQSAVGKTLEDL